MVELAIRRIAAPDSRPIKVREIVSLSTTPWNVTTFDVKEGPEIAIYYCWESKKQIFLSFLEKIMLANL